MKKPTIILTLLLLLGSKAFSQHEFEYIFDSIKNETPCSRFYDIIELDNGDFIINGKDIAHNYTPNIYRFSPIGDLVTEKQFHDEFKLPGYTQQDKEGAALLTDKNGGFYLFLAYNPIFDTTHANYVPGTFDAKIMMKKLNDDFEIEYSKEMSVCLDTVDWKNLWGEYHTACTPPLFQIGTVMDDDSEGFIISYEKYIGKHPVHLWDHGKDTTFFIKTDYDLNIKKENCYAHEICNNVRHKNHLLYDKELDKYLYYASYDWSGIVNKGFNIFQFDSDFNLIEENCMPNTDGIGWYKCLNYIDGIGSTAGITFKRTTSHTTIFGAAVDYWSVTSPGISEYLKFVSCVEVNDNATRADSVRFAYTYPDPGGGGFGYTKTIIPNGCCMDWVDENKIFIGGQPYAHAFSETTLIARLNKNFILRRLDRNFNTLDELYYNMGVDSTSLYITTLKATNDGGCIIAGHFRNYVENPDDNFPSAFKSVVKKFPPEAFDGIDEAHENGLRLAIAYPNPGNSRLNIRTTLPNAHVEVYDINGKLIHNQIITDMITSINSEKWHPGIYIWKVFSANKEAESGKWVKE